MSAPADLPVGHIGIVFSRERAWTIVAVRADGQTWITRAETSDEAFAVAIAALRGILRIRAIHALERHTQK